MYILFLLKIDELAIKPSASPQIIPGTYPYSHRNLTWWLWMFISSRHLTVCCRVCFSVQALVHLLRSTITPWFPSFPQFLTHFPTHPWAAVTAHQTTSTLTTCHGALKSSRRRLNLSQAHICPPVCPASGKEGGQKKKALVRLFTQNLHLEQRFNDNNNNYFWHQWNIYLIQK